MNKLHNYKALLSGVIATQISVPVEIEGEPADQLHVVLGDVDHENVVINVFWDEHGLNATDSIGTTPAQYLYREDSEDLADQVLALIRALAFADSEPFQIVRDWEPTPGVQRAPGPKNARYDDRVAFSYSEMARALTPLGTVQAVKPAEVRAAVAALIAAEQLLIPKREDYATRLVVDPVTNQDVALPGYIHPLDIGKPLNVSSRDHVIVRVAA